MGNSNSGKSALVIRFAESRFLSKSSPTCGAFFITKRIQTSNEINCKVQIWDTAGKPQYRQMAPMYYKSAAAAIVCYDARDRESYNGMRQWLEELRRNVPAGNIVIAVAATKCDDDDGQPTIPLQDAVEFAHSQGAFHATTSAKMNLGIDDLFQHVAERVLCFRSDRTCSIPVTPGATPTLSDKHRYISNHKNTIKNYPRSLTDTDNDDDDMPTNRSLFSDDDESTGERYATHNNAEGKGGGIQRQDSKEKSRLKDGKELSSENDNNVNDETNEKQTPSLNFCDLGPSMCGMFAESNAEKLSNEKKSLSCLVS